MSHHDDLIRQILSVSFQAIEIIFDFGTKLILDLNI